MYGEQWTNLEILVGSFFNTVTTIKYIKTYFKIVSFGNFACARVLPLLNKKPFLIVGFKLRFRSIGSLI